MVVTLINPVAMDEGLRFAIREGGRTVGAGVVAKIVKYSSCLRAPTWVGACFFAQAAIRLAQSGRYPLECKTLAAT